MKRSFRLARWRKDLFRRPSDESQLSLISCKDEEQTLNKIDLGSHETNSASSFDSDPTEGKNNYAVESPATDESQQSWSRSSSSSTSYDTEDESWRQHGHGLRLNILEEELRYPKCESCNPAVPLESYFALCKKVLEAFTTTIRRSSDDSQLLLHIYLEAFVYAHRFQDLHSRVVSIHPMFYNQMYKYKCLRIEHVSKLYFILSCIEELSERIDLLVYNDTLNTNAAAAVFRILLGRPSPWTANGEDGSQAHQDVKDNPMVESNGDSFWDDQQNDVSCQGEDEGGASPYNDADPFESRDFLNFEEEPQHEKMNYDDEEEDEESDRDSEFNAPILKGEFEPYPDDIPTVTTPESIHPIFESPHDTPRRVPRTWSSPSNAYQSPTMALDAQERATAPMTPGGLVVEPPEVRRICRKFSPTFNSLFHKYEQSELVNSPTTESLHQTHTDNSESKQENHASPSFEESTQSRSPASKQENHASPSFEVSMHYRYPVTGSKEDHVSPSFEDSIHYRSPQSAIGSKENHANQGSPTASYRSPTRAIRSYKDAAETLKVLMHRSPCSTATAINTNYQGKPEGNNDHRIWLQIDGTTGTSNHEKPINVSSSFTTHGTADESFEEISFSGRGKSENQKAIHRHSGYVNTSHDSKPQSDEKFLVPASALKSSGRYKDLPDHVLANS